MDTSNITIQKQKLIKNDNRRLLCKHCRQPIVKDDIYYKVNEIEMIQVKELGKIKDKTLTIHQECLDAHINDIHDKFEDISKRSVLYDFVKEFILDMKDVNVPLPSNFYSRIEDLRNGTIKKEGFYLNNNKMKAGVKYEVIMMCFVEKMDDIKYVLKTKKFETISNKINYILAIIESSISETLDNYNKRKEKDEIVKEKIKEVNSELSISLDNIKETDEKLQQKSKKVNVKQNVKLENDMNDLFDPFADLF